MQQMVYVTDNVGTYPAFATYPGGIPIAIIVFMLLSICTISLNKFKKYVSILLCTNSQVSGTGNL